MILEKLVEQQKVSTYPDFRLCFFQICYSPSTYFDTEETYACSLCVEYF